MASLPLYTKQDGKQDSPRHPLARSASGLVPPQHAAQQLAQQMLSAGLWTLAAPLAPVAVLCAGIYVTSLPAGPGRPVDRESCGCTCWDGRFKGRHGLATSGIEYKSVYFNLEPATALLAAWVCVWLNLLGLCLQRILQLARAGRLSFRALVPALLQFYPMFYGAWAVFNYVNDRFYVMLPSQLFFQLTELVPCFFIYTLLDRQNYAQLQPLVPVLGLAVNSAHVLLALKERVLWGLFMPGIHTVNGRDVMLMAGDVSCLVFFGSLLRACKSSRQELVQLAPWGLCTVVVLLVVYVVGLGYVYQ